MIQDDAKRLRRIKLAAMLGMVGFVALIALFMYNSLRFYITSTDPTKGQMTTWTTMLRVTFNKTISAHTVSISSNPSNGVYNNQYSVNGKTLTIQLNVPLNAQQTYTFTIHRITSTNGQVIRNVSFTYTPRSIPRSKIAEDDQENLIMRNQHASAYQDPIISHLPYSTLYFILTSSFPTDTNNIPHLVLQAQILLAPNLSPSEQAADTTQYKQQVLDYIRSLGLNPSHYTIQYQVVQETPSGP